jgi:opacity protein-like surface antigen
MRITRSLLAAAILVTIAVAAQAEIILTPYYGTSFGGTTTENSPTYGGAVGILAGGWLGAEVEYGYVQDFFGSSDTGAGLSQNKVQSLSASLLLGVNLGPLRPYGAAGLSVIGANLASQPGLAALDDTAPGYNAGGGLFIWLGKHIGLRGDIRYFRTFEAVGADSALALEKVDYWRGIGGLTLRF